MADIIYEEGTWTPTLYGQLQAGTADYATRTGIYRRVGNLVFVQCSITAGLERASGMLMISGLPFRPSTAGGLSIGTFSSPLNEVVIARIGTNSLISFRRGNGNVDASIGDYGLVIEVSGTYAIN